MNVLTSMKYGVPIPAEAEPFDVEILSRIERMTGQNAETLGENTELIERSVSSLRSNTEMLSEIKDSIFELRSTTGDLITAQQSLAKNISELAYEEPTAYEPAPAPVSPVIAGSSEEDKEEILGAIGDNRMLLNMIRQDMLNGMNANREEAEEETETVEPLSADLADKYYKDLEEHVHKECVKCYRNVQSALTEQNKETIDGVTGSVSTLRILAIASLAVNVAGIVILVCRILNII